MAINQLMLWAVVGIGILAFSCGLTKSAEVDPQTKLYLMRQKCKQSANLTEEQFTSIVKKRLFTLTPEPTNIPKNIHCYLLCYFHETGIFDDNQPHAELLTTSLTQLISSENRAKETVEKCSTELGADHCETALKFVYCLNKETGLLFY